VTSSTIPTELAALFEQVTRTDGKGAVYGPGRGLWIPRARALPLLDKGIIELRGSASLGAQAKGVWVVTCGAGALGKSAKLFKRDPETPLPDRPSFHCSSFTGFVAGMLDGRGVHFDHRATLVPLEALLENHVASWKKTGVRGYAGQWRQLYSDGSTNDRRSGKDVSLRYMDAQELADRSDELPSVCLAAQSSLGSKGWKWEHHTLVVYRDGTALRRIAADGSAWGPMGNRRYNAEKMNIETFDAATVKDILNTRLFALWAFDPPEGPRLPPDPLAFEVPR
jgi:hypothetical protein